MLINKHNNNESNIVKVNEELPIVHNHYSVKRKIRNKRKSRNRIAIKARKAEKRLKYARIGRLRARASKVSFITKSSKGKLYVKEYAADETINIEIPPVFSFLEDPITASKIINKIMFAANNKKIKHIFIDHGNCSTLGL